MRRTVSVHLLTPDVYVYYRRPQHEALVGSSSPGVCSLLIPAHGEPEIIIPGASKMGIKTNSPLVPIKLTSDSVDTKNIRGKKAAAIQLYADSA